jgi:hypothetical protein
MEILVSASFDSYPLAALLLASLRSEYLPDRTNEPTTPAADDDSLAY